MQGLFDMRTVDLLVYVVGFLVCPILKNPEYSIVYRSFVCVFSMSGAIGSQLFERIWHPLRGIMYKI